MHILTWYIEHHPDVLCVVTQHSCAWRHKPSGAVQAWVRSTLWCPSSGSGANSLSLNAKGWVSFFCLFVWFSALHARWKRKNDRWTDSDHVFEGRQSLDLQLRILSWTNGRLKKYLIPEDTVNFLFQILNTVELLLWDTSIQGTAPFRGLKIWSRKNVHRIFVFVTSTEGILLFRGKKHFFWVPKPGFNFYSGNTLALKKVKKWLTTIIVDTVFRSALLSYGESFQIMNHLT